MSYSLSQIQNLLRQAGWPESLIAKYAAIVMYESGGNVKAYNGNNEDSYGLLQVYLKYHPTFDTSRAADPLYNLSYAYGIYQREGDNAWKTSVGKYNRDYRGIASQSRDIYISGGGNDYIDTSNVDNTVNADINNSNLSDSGNIIFYIVAAGAIALLYSRR